MEATSKNLFIVFVLACFAAGFCINTKNQTTRFIVRDRHSMDAHIIFDTKYDAEQYVNHYREYHDYLIEEKKN